MSKTYAVAGVSKQNGEYKVRFANDMLRVKVLEKNGHKDIDLVEFISPLTKEAAVAKLLEMNFAKGDVAIQAALELALDKRTPKAGSKDAPKKEPKKPKKPKSTPSLDAIKARGVAAKAQSVEAAKAAVASELEDAPY